MMEVYRIATIEDALDIAAHALTVADRALDQADALATLVRRLLIPHTTQAALNEYQRKLTQQRARLTEFHAAVENTRALRTRLAEAPNGEVQ